jgi:hypothetical protein
MSEGTETPTPGERRGLWIPTWLVALLITVLAVGVGFSLGRATAADHETVSVQTPSGVAGGLGSALSPAQQNELSQLIQQLLKRLGSLTRPPTTTNPPKTPTTK